MSLIRETTGSMPKIVGGGLVLAGVLSTLSLSVDGPAVLNVPGGTFWDVLAGIGAVGVGGKIWSDRSSTAAVLGAGLLVLGLTSAGWEFNTKQAGNMVSASFSAIKEGAKAGAEAGANTAGATQTAQWSAVRPLNPAEIAECEAALKAWTRTPLGQLNCAPASDGIRYKWRSTT
jgi:hypothetical protein